MTSSTNEYEWHCDVLFRRRISSGSGDNRVGAKRRRNCRDGTEALSTDSGQVWSFKVVHAENVRITLTRACTRKPDTRGKDRPGHNSRAVLLFHAPLNIQVPIRELGRPTVRGDSLVKWAGADPEITIYNAKQGSVVELVKLTKTYAGEEKSIPRARPSPMPRRPNKHNQLSRGQLHLAVATGNISERQAVELHRSAIGASRDLPIPRHLILQDTSLVNEAKLNEQFRGLIRQRRYRQPGVYRVFPKQSQAIDFVRNYKLSDSNSDPPRVFSEDITSDGARRFIAATYDEFYTRYMALKDTDRHFYEVIVENEVCHLYFDIEYSKTQYPGLDDAGIMGNFFAILLPFMQTQLKLHSLSQEEHILQLDSTTATKFSRHVIVRLQDSAWVNNIHMGNFVHSLARHIHSLAQDGDTRAQSLFPCLAKNDSSNSNTPGPKRKLQPQDLFLDLGVYTRNRNFRLYLSSKLGKATCLHEADDNRYKAHLREINVVSSNHDEHRAEEMRALFMASLICRVQYSPDLYMLHCGTDHRLQRKSWLNGITSGGGGSGGGGPSNVHTSSSTSAFPAIDAFVRQSWLNRQGVHGVFRNITYLADQRMLIYQCARNRYCARIQRHHKSNNIMIIVDMKQRVSYQRCHDPDCRGYRSPEEPLPEQVLPAPPHPSFNTASPVVLDPVCIAGESTASASGNGGGGAQVFNMSMTEYDQLLQGIEQGDGVAGGTVDRQGTSFESVDDYILFIGSNSAARVVLDIPSDEGTAGAGTGISQEAVRPGVASQASSSQFDGEFPDFTPEELAQLP